MGNPALATLSDPFAGSALDGANWYVEPDAGNGKPSGAVSVSGGVLSLSGGAFSDTGFYTSVNSQGAYTLTGSYAFAQVTPGESGTGDGDSGFGLYAANFSDGYNYDITGGFLQVETTVSDNPTVVHKVAYDPASMAWLRVEESGGTISFQTSPTGESGTWTTQYATTTESVGSWTAASTYVQLFYGSNSGTKSPSGTAGFSSFNVAPAGGGGTPAASYTLVQSAGAQDSSSASLPAASQAGHALVAVPWVYIPSGGPWPTAMSDDGGNAWPFPSGAQDGPPPAALNGGYPLWLSAVVNARAATTVTFTDPGNYPEVASLSEWAGVGGLGAAAAASSSASSAPSVQVAYGDGDLVIAACYCSAASMGTPAGFTAMPGAESNNVSVCYQVMSGSGTLTVTWPSASATWAAVAQVLTASAAPPAPSASPPSPPLLGMYMTGGAFPGAPAAWPSGPATNMSATYAAWGQDLTAYVSPFLGDCAASGLVPYVELEPWHSGPNWTVTPLFGSITDGSWDPWLTQLGTLIAGTGRRCMLTFAHEFNVSGQYPWAQGANATLGPGSGSGPGGADLTPAEWIAGWQYVHDKVNATAGGLALWMWACNAWTGGSTVDPSPWWPGSGYVDMCGIDGYPSTQYGQSLGTFTGQFGQTVTAIRNLGWSEPIFISETNLAQMVSSGGESITAFVADMAAAGMSGMLEFETATDGEPQMSAAQWAEYNSAVAANYAPAVTPSALLSVSIA